MSEQEVVLGHSTGEVDDEAGRGETPVAGEDTAEADVAAENTAATDTD